jgi:hypothetical protein
VYCCGVRRYVERLSGSLQRKAGQEAKMLAAAAETQARQQESRAMLAGLQPKVSLGYATASSQQSTPLSHPAHFFLFVVLRLQEER